MADNVAITAGLGTEIATDQIGTVHHQRVKLSLGADGVAVDLQPATLGAVASDATTDQLTSVAGTLFGFSFRENAGSPAAAEIIIRDGTSDAAPIVAVINLGADESVRDWFGPQGLEITTGIRVQKVSGTTEGSVWYV